MPQHSERLTLWQKIGYGLGDTYGGGASTLVGFYYLYFLTDVVRLNPALAGVVILVSKIYRLGHRSVRGDPVRPHPHATGKAEAIPAGGDSLYFSFVLPAVLPV